MRRIAYIFLLFACFSVIPASAGSEKLALVYPLQGITIDGDLSDWPEGMIRYPILHRDDGDPLRGTRDFEGWFRIGYSQAENALYVAVEVEDDSVVRGELGQGQWNTQDGCEIYLHGHQPDVKAPVQYYIWGPNRGTYGPDSSDNARVEVRWGDNGYQFEWRVDITGTSSGKLRLHPDMELGFDISIWERDRDGTASWIAWNPGTGKFWNADAIGKLVLVEEDISIARALQLVGQVTEKRSSDFETIVKKSVGIQMFFSGVLFAFTLLHLLLFLFDPKTKANLFYAIYTGLIAAALFSGFQLEFTAYISSETISLIRQLALLVVNFFGLCFLYSLFNPKPPRRFWVLPVGLTLLGVLISQESAGWFDVPMLFISFSELLVFLLSGGLFVEILLALFNAVRQKKEGAWIIGVGFSVFALNISPLIQQTQIDITLLYWVFIPLVSMSVYLARSVARTNKTLHKQLVQVEELSTKTHEQYAQIQEQNLQIQEANRLKSDFLARMSHDLRTPMNAIIGYTRIMLRKTREQLDDRQYRNLENVQVSANNLLVLINDILDLSKIEAGRLDVKLDEVDFGQLAAECAASVETLTKPDVHLLQDLEDIPPVRTDPDRMRRVLMNLLSNALKFTEEGSITVSLKRAGDWTELSVADTGVGIPADDLPYIFDEFRQVDRKDSSRKEGTGLGLAIVKKSMELLGGTVRVESEVDRGSVFILRIRDYEKQKLLAELRIAERETGVSS